jgi:hypothetical protein
VTGNEYVTIVSAESQEVVTIDVRHLRSVSWAPHSSNSGADGARRWLSKSETEALRGQLSSLDPWHDGESISNAIELIDFALSTGTGLAVILP